MGKYCVEEYKPLMVMVVVQFFVAINALIGKMALAQGVSITIFVAYRQAIAAILLGTTTLVATRKGNTRVALGLKSFGLMFVAAFMGAVLSQNLFYQGLKLSSASAATAVGNSIPAITFIMAACIGLEKVQMNARSMAKILGTIICVGGAISVALVKGPKLLNMQFQTLPSISHIVGDDWMKGCLFVFASNCCWSFWLILQVPICEKYLDPLPFASWLCFLGTWQSAMYAYFLEPDLGAWKINSGITVLCLLYSGIVGSGVVFYLQSWCISKRGPLYTAMFNPLSTVIVTISAALFLHEELYLGSLAGAVAVVGGLYIVLWGKAKDYKIRRDMYEGEDYTKVTITVDESSNDTDMKEPLLNNSLHMKRSETENALHMKRSETENADAC